MRKKNKQASKKINFQKPPLHEVVFGVQFAPISRFLVGHVGRLWDEYSADYPICRENPPLNTFPETLPGEPFTMPDLFTAMPRTVFATADDSSVIQIQRDAFYYNWQKTDKNQEYPRYENICEQFESKFKIFREFIEKLDLGCIEPIQLELTYLNEIPVDAPVSRLLKDAQWVEDQHKFLPPPESVAIAASFLLPEKTGRLHSNFRSIVKDNGEVVYHWYFIARGSVNPKSDMTLDNLRPWFDNAREWIVRSFADMSSEEAQNELWEKVK